VQVYRVDNDIGAYKKTEANKIEKHDSSKVFVFHSSL